MFAGNNGDPSSTDAEPTEESVGLQQTAAEGITIDYKETGDAGEEHDAVVLEFINTHYRTCCKHLYDILLNPPHTNVLTICSSVLSIHRIALQLYRH